MRITVLTPNLPPLVCGLADHSWLLGQALEQLGCTVDLIGLRAASQATCEEVRQSTALWDGSVQGLSRLVAARDPDWLWVQLSHYGYSRIGAPWRLGLALRLLRHRCPRIRIAVCMHESYCLPGQLGPKGILLSPLQKFLVGDIVKSSDLVFPTISQRARVCIEEFGIHDERIRVLPIAANVPPITVSPEQRVAWRAELGFSPEQRIAVTFGLWSSQHTTLKLFSSVLETAFARRDIDGVLAIGGEDKVWPPWAKTLPRQTPWQRRLTILGPQTGARVARILALTDVGLVPTPLEFWEKSGAARAFQQAGLLIWVLKGQKLSKIETGSVRPTWESLARQVVSSLGDCEQGLRSRV